MRKKFSFFHPILVFILAQLAWLSLLGLWIYWYVSNYIIFKQVGEDLSPQIISKSTNIVALVWGCILLLLVLGGMYFIFIFLTKQINLTRFYDNFIANVTHELKSPLASIQLYLETMYQREIPRSRQKEFLVLMIADADRLKNQINSILKISGLEKKKLAHNFRVYSADEIVQKLLEEIIEKYKLPKNSIEVEELASCQFVADRDDLNIVFDNLINNAIKYSIGTLQLTFRLTCTTKYVVLEFTDSGIGISAGHQKKIFNKFYRIYDSDIPNIKGTGLGLYMVKEIVKNHGGNITVNSEGKNRGTTFRIELSRYRSTKKGYVNRLLNKTHAAEEERYED